MNTIESSCPYQFDPQSPLYAFVGVASIALQEAPTARYRTLCEHIFAYAAASPFTAEQWDAVTATWTAAFLAVDVSSRPWHVAMARVVQSANGVFGLPAHSPFQPIRLFGPEGLWTVVSFHSLKEFMGWDTDIRASLQLLDEADLNLVNVSPQAFNALICSITWGPLSASSGTQDPLLPHILPELFFIADRWSAPALQSLIIERCKQLLATSDLADKRKIVREVIHPMMVANANIANHVDLSDFLPSYCNLAFISNRARLVTHCLAAIQQAETPSECLAVAYWLSRMERTTLRQLDGRLQHHELPPMRERITAAMRSLFGSSDSVPLNNYPSTTREQLIAAVRSLATATTWGFASMQRRFAWLNFTMELRYWCDEAVHAPEAAGRQEAARLIMEAFRNERETLDCSELALTTLPDAIRYLSQLEELHAIKQCLAFLPDWICDLRLKRLSVNNNNLKALGEIVTKLPRCAIHAWGNPFTAHTIEQIRREALRRDASVCLTLSDFHNEQHLLSLEAQGMAELLNRT